MNNEKTKNNFDLIKISNLLWKKKKKVIKNCAIAGVIAAALIVCVPRYYTCDVMLAPEFDSGSASGLAGLAASFGINVGGAGSTSDAISPSLYPDLLTSKDFLIKLFPIQIKTVDGSLKTDYYTYLSKHQDKAWWNAAYSAIVKAVKKLFEGEDTSEGNGKKLDPFRLNEKDYNMAENIASRISCSVDRVSSVITIQVTDQDPLVCATIADSVRCKLQDFITVYRTNKARNDFNYYAQLLDEAKKDYDKSRLAYSHYADTHHDMIMEVFISERDELEYDMQSKYRLYTTLLQQYDAAKAKIQERTPAFTILRCASVPIKPAGPKRVLFVLFIMFLTFLVTGYFLVRREGKEAMQDKTQTEEPEISSADNKDTL